MTVTDLPRPIPAALTEADRQLIAMLADGLTTKQIGRRLGVSTEAAEKRTSRLYAKTGTANAAQLVATTLPLAPRPLIERIAAWYGDTPEVTKARRAALLAELRAHDTRPASNRAAWQRRTLTAHEHEGSQR